MSNTTAARRNAGLCILCGDPAQPIMRRGRAVNQRLAEGRGHSSEYVAILGPCWREGDPPPTPARLATSAYCAPCERSSDEQRTQRRVKEQAVERRLETRRNDRAEQRNRRIGAGVCYECNDNPPAPGSNRCRQCTEQATESARNRRIRRKAEGICTKCGQRPANLDLSTCSLCNAKQTVAVNRRTAVRRRLQNGESDEDISHVLRVSLARVAAIRSRL